MVQIHEFDLVVGDVLCLGEKTMTVVDVENGEVTFRIDDDDDHEVFDNDVLSIDQFDSGLGPVPR